MLVLMSGLPGCGKSTLADALARELGACVISVDPIENAILRSGIARSFETGLAAYEVGATVAVHQLGLGLTVIADAANDLEVGREIWRRAAKASGVELKVIHVECSDPELHRARLESRARDLDHFPEPSWAEVELRRAESEPWAEPHLTLDSTRTLAAMLESAIDYLQRT